MPEFRQDPVTGRWVIIAPARNARPRYIEIPSDQKRSEPCPFCAGNESMTPPEVWAARYANTKPNSPGWRVRVVPNKYPALQNSGERFAKKDGLYQALSGLGVHEVIIESPEHVVNMSALREEQIVDILCAYRARLRILKNDRRWGYLLIYKNHGERAGATFEHVHSQLVAMSFVPREAQDEIDGIHRHFESTRRCIYCDIIKSESEHGERLVFKSDRFLALCPFAPRFGYETWIFAKKPCGRFRANLRPGHYCPSQNLARVYRETKPGYRQITVQFGDPQRAQRTIYDQRYHWHMEILPQITRAAGFEWGTGVHMNSVAPEHAARLFRDGAL